MNTDLIEKIRETFREIFRREAEGIYFAPGRINLIGEHTDYNGGHVLPCAIPSGTYGAIALRNDRRLRLYSLNFSETGVCELSLDELAPGRTDQWTAYPEGTVWAMGRRMGELPGCGADIVFAGDVPAGSGLSSSASIEVLTGLMIKEAYGQADLSGAELARIAQYGENNYNGVKCGIMDQFASAMGKKDRAIYLDTDSLDYEMVPLELGEAKLVITNSRVKHSLVSSAYNDRRRECGEALREFRSLPALADVQDLCSISEEDFETYGECISDEVLRMRAEHVIREEARTGKAAETLKRGDTAAFGMLMNQSHESLRDKYQVSCPEIDLLTELAWEFPGTLGSRITGGGFGGCTISLVRDNGVDEFIERVGNGYREKFGRMPDFYVVQACEGARKLDV